MTAPSLRDQFRRLVVLGITAAVGSCAAPPARKIDLDHAVAIANAAASHSLDPRRPLRVVIATEKDARSLRRCLHGDDAVPPYVQSVREKVVGRRLYVIRYPLPPVTREDGHIDYVGTEPCVLIDRDTGDVLGAFSD